MRLSRLLDVLEASAPAKLAESWDKVGLHTGSPRQQIRRALLCIDLTGPVLREAAGKRCELIVAYHPLIFSPVDRLTEGDDWKQDLLVELLRRKIAVYSPHTALDAVAGGLTDWLCQGLGKGQSKVIEPATCESPGYKIITFVPQEQVLQVRDAMFSAGAGVIGAYSHCSFSHPGMGTFKGSVGTDPFIGIPGRLERVAELRLEMACRPRKLAAALAALKAAHPYEEPAIDVLQLHAVSESRQGAGRIHTLDQSVSVATLTRRIRQLLKVKHLEVADAGQRVRRIAVCPGAGGSLLSPLHDVDALFTGEMRHHDVLSARQRGISVFLAGHTQTERPYLPTYRGKLAKATGSAVRWIVSRADMAPSVVV